MGSSAAARLLDLSGSARGARPQRVGHWTGEDSTRTGLPGGGHWRCIHFGSVHPLQLLSHCDSLVLLLFQLDLVMPNTLSSAGQSEVMASLVE